MWLEGFKYAKATKDVWVNGALRAGRREEINKINPGRKKKLEKKKNHKEKDAKTSRNNPALMFMQFQI